jgi:hypothetical protein
MSAGVEIQSVDVASLLADVIEVTKELFPGDVMIDVVRDPEHAQTRLTVIEARASGSPESVVDRGEEWHRRVAGIGESCANLCLTFNFDE